MTNISKINLSNFRIFKEETQFELAPITILTGANNSGKSTLIRAMKLLVESARESSLLYLLRFASETGYSLPEDVYSKGDKSKEIIFNFTSTLDSYFDEYHRILKKNVQSEEVNVKLVYSNSEIIDNSFLMLKELSIKNITGKSILEINVSSFIGKTPGSFEIEMDLIQENYFKTDFNRFFSIYLDVVLEKNGVNDLLKKYHIDQPIRNNIISKLRKAFESDNSSGHDSSVLYTNFKTLKEFLSHFQFSMEKNMRPLIPEGGVLPYRDARINNFIDFLIKLNNLDLKDQDIFLLSTTLVNSIEELNFKYDEYNEGILNQVCKNILSFNHYMPTFRGKMTREVMRSDNSILSKKVFEILDNDKKIQGVNNFTISGKKIPIKYRSLKFVNQALYEILDMRYELYINFNQNNGKHELLLAELNLSDKKTKLKDLSRINLADMGSGTYHLILMLLDIELAIIDGNYYNKQTEFEESKKSNCTVLLEEPEVSLHPNFQSKLADIMALAYNEYGVKFVVETHSEYLIRKFQFLIAKQKNDAEDLVKLKKEDVLIYYLEKNTLNLVYVNKIEIAKDGSLSKNFGTGFFDEADKIALELFLLKNHQNN